MLYNVNLIKVRQSFLLLFFVALGMPAYAQQTEVITNKLIGDIKEEYHVLKSNPSVKQGIFQVKYNKKIVLASGQYNNNKRIGTWHFYDNRNNTVQHYDYDKHRLMYEAPENSATRFQYQFDKNFTATDLVTKPVKIGGWYYGYLPYLAIFKIPADMLGLNLEGASVTLQLLISPGGMLADYTITIHPFMYDDRVLNVKLSLFTDDERQFVPATVNKEAVSSTIIIPCRIKNNDLVFEGLY